MGHAEALREFASNFELSPLSTKGLEIERRYGERVRLDRDTDLYGLAKWVIENSVPWIACQKKCPASSYCPLAAPRSIWGSADDDRCGVMGNAIGTFIFCAGSTLRVRSPRRLQALVDTARLYADLALSSMQSLGTALSPGVLRWWATSAADSMRGSTLHISGLSQSVLESWSLMSSSGPRSILWLFEGTSEMLFFSSLLRAHHGEAFVPSRAIDLGGIGSMKNAKLLVRQKCTEGMEPLLLLDSGSVDDDKRVESFVGAGLIRRKNVLRFRKDFESSFPKQFLATIFGNLIAVQHRTALEEALRAYRRRRSRGFTSEFKAALRSHGMRPEDASVYVNDKKVRAARQMADHLRPHLQRILSSSSRTPEIERVIRRVVESTRDYSRPLGSAPYRARLAEQKSQPS